MFLLGILRKELLSLVWIEGISITARVWVGKSTTNAYRILVGNLHERSYRLNAFGNSGEHGKLESTCSFKKR